MTKKESPGSSACRSDPPTEAAALRRTFCIIIIEGKVVIQPRMRMNINSIQMRDEMEMRWRIDEKKMSILLWLNHRGMRSNRNRNRGIWLDFVVSARLAVDSFHRSRAPRDYGIAITSTATTIVAFPSPFSLMISVTHPFTFTFTFTTLFSLLSLLLFT